MYSIWFTNPYCIALRRKRHTYMVISVYCSGNEWDQVMPLLPDILPLAKRLSTLHTAEPWQTEVCNKHALFYVLYKHTVPMEKLNKKLKKTVQ
jgi:hypothetical protein